MAQVELDRTVSQILTFEGVISRALICETHVELVPAHCQRAFGERWAEAGARPAERPQGIVELVGESTGGRADRIGRELHHQQLVEIADDAHSRIAELIGFDRTEVRLVRQACRRSRQGDLTQDQIGKQFGEMRGSDVLSDRVDRDQYGKHACQTRVNEEPSHCRMSFLLRSRRGSQRSNVSMIHEPACRRRRITRVTVVSRFDPALGIRVCATLQLTRAVLSSCTPAPEHRQS